VVRIGNQMNAIAHRNAQVLADDHRHARSPRWK
jgi:hypothetical protein